MSKKEKRLKDMLEVLGKVGCESFEEENVGGNCGNVEKYGEKQIIMVAVEEIMPNRAQPRRIFDNDALMELAESIKDHGVIQPIVVRKCEDLVGSVFKYELVAGERRLRASKLAGVVLVPCVLINVDEKESAELAIIENLHRKDLNIFETAAAIYSLIEIYGLTQEEVACKLLITQSAVANKLRLLRLSEVEREIIITNNLTERHARCLLKLHDGDVRLKVLRRIVEKGLNVNGSEMLVDEVVSGVSGSKTGEMENFEVEKHRNCVNIIQKAIEKLRKAGCGTKSTCTETDDFYIYTITVDKEVSL